MSTKHAAGRRGFIKQTAAMTAGLAGLGMLSEVEAATPRQRGQHSWAEAAILTPNRDDGF